MLLSCEHTSSGPCTQLAQSHHVPREESMQGSHGGSCSGAGPSATPQSPCSIVFGWLSVKRYVVLKHGMVVATAGKNKLAGSTLTRRVFIQLYRRMPPPT